VADCCHAEGISRGDAKIRSVVAPKRIKLVRPDKNINYSNIIEFAACRSEEVAIEMAEGLLRRFDTDFAISTTGIAGPDGGTAEKPVGTVWIGIATKTSCYAQRFQLGEQRDRNIRRSALAALNMLRLCLLPAND
jgi:nicotinamide-nucleotide amidase